MYDKWDALCAEMSDSDENPPPDPEYLPHINKIVKDWGDNPPPMDKHAIKQMEEEMAKRAVAKEEDTAFGRLMEAVSSRSHREPLEDPNDPSVETWKKSRDKAREEAEPKFKKLVAACLEEEPAGNTKMDATAVLTKFLDRSEILFDWYLGPLLVKELVEQGSSVDVWGAETGINALHVCLMWEEGGHDVFDLVLSKMANETLLRPAAQDYTTLHFAATRLRQVTAYHPLAENSCYMLSALLKRGVPVDSTNNLRITALEELNKFMSLGDFSEDSTPGECKIEEVLKFRKLLVDAELELKKLNQNKGPEKTAELEASIKLLESTVLK